MKRLFYFYSAFHIVRLRFKIRTGLMKLGSGTMKKTTPFRMFSLAFFEFYYTRGKICKRNNDASTEIVSLHKLTLFHLIRTAKEVVKMHTFCRKLWISHSSSCAAPCDNGRCIPNSIESPEYATQGVSPSIYPLRYIPR